MKQNSVSRTFLLLQLEKSISEQKVIPVQKVLMYRQIWYGSVKTYGEEEEKVKYDIEILGFQTGRG